MVNRRKVLLGVGSAITVAGCTGETDTTTTNTDRNTATPTTTEKKTVSTETKTEITESANFTFLNTSPHGESLETNSTILEAVVTNTGEKQSAQEIVISFEENIIRTVTVSLDPGERKTVQANISSFNPYFENYVYSFESENESITGTFSTSVAPVENPSNVPDYSIAEEEDVSYGDTIRRDYDITMKDGERGLLDLRRKEVMAIARDVIIDSVKRRDVNAIGLNFWHSGQTIGAEQAQLVIEWAPNGSWSDAGSVEAGDYSNFEFNLIGRGYVKIEEIYHPSSVETGESYHVTIRFVNKGFVKTTISGFIERDDEVVDEFNLNMDPGEKENYGTTLPPYEFSIAGTLHSIEGSGFDQIHGVSLFDIELE